MSRSFLRARALRISAVVAAPIVGLLVMTGAAHADTNPSVAVGADVPQSVSITGVTGSVNFANAVAGQTDTISGAEQYTVSSNSPGGYVLRVSSGSNVFAGSGSANIPNTDWTIRETGTAAGKTVSPSTTQVVIDASGAPGSGTYSEDWSLAVPPNQMPGSYTGSLAYFVVGA